MAKNDDGGKADYDVIIARVGIIAEFKMRKAGEMGELQCQWGLERIGSGVIRSCLRVIHFGLQSGAGSCGR